MKAEEYRTLCLMCWSLGLFLLLLGVFAGTYYTVYKSWLTDDWWIEYPYRHWGELLSFVGFVFLIAGVESFRHSHKMPEKKD